MCCKHARRSVSSILKQRKYLIRSLILEVYIHIHYNVLDDFSYFDIYQQTLEPAFQIFDLHQINLISSISLPLPWVQVIKKKIKILPLLPLSILSNSGVFVSFPFALGLKNCSQRRQDHHLLRLQSPQACISERCCMSDPPSYFRIYFILYYKKPSFIFLHNNGGESDTTMTKPLSATDYMLS